MVEGYSQSHSRFVTRNTRAIAIFDVSGSTTLWHETRVRDFDSQSAGHQRSLANALGFFFESAVELAKDNDLIFLNTTGDGFVVASHPTHWSLPGISGKDPNYHPCQMIYDFYVSVCDTFANLISSPIRDRKYICANTISLRVGLHYGWVYRLKNQPEDFFFGDSLNYAARLMDTQTAREGMPASSFSFFKRFHRLGTKDPGQPEETIRDRNKYPEPIPVFNLHDRARARNMIARVRHYFEYTPDRLASVIFDVRKIRALLESKEVDPIGETKRSFSISYSYAPPGEANRTSVNFAVERGYSGDSEFEGKTVKLRILHKDFENVAPRTWIRELSLWNKRLKLLHDSRWQ